ncbi:MAG: carboxymuconolactone decarboxylase [Gammaproteobacteria bacterium]|nr:carboxymuconolactone decarboxylase [Gammaproteobacteria bacterium]
MAQIEGRRAGGLLNLDRLLLNSPPFARGWNSHHGAVRAELELDQKLRELAICGVGILNGAEYEFEQHAPELRRAGGTGAQLHALRRFEAASKDESLFDAVERAVMRLTLEMTRYVRVSDETFASVRSALSDERHVVELVGVIATYNMVSRFLVALEVELEKS